MFPVSSNEVENNESSIGKRFLEESENLSKSLKKLKTASSDIKAASISISDSVLSASNSMQFDYKVTAYYNGLDQRYKISVNESWLVHNLGKNAITFNLS